MVGISEFIPSVKYQWRVYICNSLLVFVFSKFPMDNICEDYIEQLRNEVETMIDDAMVMNSDMSDRSYMMWRNALYLGFDIDSFQGEDYGNYLCGKYEKLPVFSRYNTKYTAIKALILDDLHCDSPIPLENWSPEWIIPESDDEPMTEPYDTTSEDESSVYCTSENEITTFNDDWEISY